MELWVFWIKLGGIAIASIAGITFARRRHAISIKTAGIMTLTSISFVALCTFDRQGRNSGLQPSLDGKYVARVMIGGGILDGGDSTVIVRRQGDLGFVRVYRGDGYMQDDGPEYPYVEWQDRRHLVIRYHGAPNGPPKCLSSFADVVMNV